MSNEYLNHLFLPTVSLKWSFMYLPVNLIAMKWSSLCCADVVLTVTVDRNLLYLIPVPILIQEVSLLSLKLCCLPLFRKAMQESQRSQLYHILFCKFKTQLDQMNKNFTLYNVVYIPSSLCEDWRFLCTYTHIMKYTMSFISVLWVYWLSVGLLVRGIMPGYTCNRYWIWLW